MTNSPTNSVLPGGYLDLVQSGLDANLPAAANVANALNRTQFYYAADTQIMYHYDPVTNAWRGVAIPGQAIAVGAALTAKANVNGLSYKLDTASGSTLTLPAAKGTGLTLTAYVKTLITSGAHKILTSPITDKLIGKALGVTASTGAVLGFQSALATSNHSIQMPFAGTQPSGGLEGDIFNFTDVEAGVWLVEAVFQSGTTPTTPFSTATT
jgi:hypothetical protein